MFWNDQTFLTTLPISVRRTTKPKASLLTQEVHQRFLGPRGTNMNQFSKILDMLDLSSIWNCSFNKFKTESYWCSFTFCSKRHLAVQVNSHPTNQLQYKNEEGHFSVESYCMRNN